MSHESTLEREAATGHIKSDSLIRLNQNPYLTSHKDSAQENNYYCIERTG